MFLEHASPTFLTTFCFFLTWWTPCLDRGPEHATQIRLESCAKVWSHKAVDNEVDRRVKQHKIPRSNNLLWQNQTTCTICLSGVLSYELNQLKRYKRNQSLYRQSRAQIGLWLEVLVQWFCEDSIFPV